MLEEYEDKLILFLNFKNDKQRVEQLNMLLSKDNHLKKTMIQLIEAIERIRLGGGMHGI